MNIQKTNFTCQREELLIRGMQFFPSNFQEDNTYPVMIFSHGFTGNYLHMAQFCEDFARIGYVTFCFNFCGGGSKNDGEDFKSEGDSRDMSVFTEVKDLSAVIEYAKSLPYVDKANIILAGGSQGGFVSGLTAAKYGNEISRLIMIFPALCIPDHARRGCMGGASYDPANVPKEIFCPNTILGKAFHEEMAAFDPYLALSAYKGPVLILHGMEDAIVDYSYSVKAWQTYEKGQCHLQLIRNMGHGMDEYQQQSVTASIRQFLDNREEILTIRVLITHCTEDMRGDTRKINIYFTGYCETSYFQGTILPYGCDAQEYQGSLQTKIRAEYTLEGLDCEGKLCTIHIVNQRGTTDFVPSITTNSDALHWLNTADLTAVLEGAAGGPTVRIFAQKENIPK